MWDAGASAQEIADRFGYNDPSAISQVARRLGLKPRKGARCSYELRAKIYEEYKLGFTFYSLAKKYDLHKGTVAVIVREFAGTEDVSNTRVKAWSCAPAAVARYLEQKGARA